MNLAAPDHNVLVTTTDFVKDGGGGVEVVAGLVNVGQFHGRPHGEGSTVGNLLFGQHAK